LGRHRKSNKRGPLIQKKSPGGGPWLTVGLEDSKGEIEKNNGLLPDDWKWGKSLGKSSE